MNHIKTYEVFLGLFKSKSIDKTVDTYDIVCCFQDLIDNEHTPTSITLDTNDNDLSDYNFYDKLAVTLKELDPFIRYKYLKKLEPNKFVFKFGYYSGDISHDEVKEMLLDGESKLEIFDCKATFYVNFHSSKLSDEGYNWYLGSFNNVNRMYNTIKKHKYCQRDHYYGIIVEIESKYNIVNREKYFGL